MSDASGLIDTFAAPQDETLRRIRYMKDNAAAIIAARKRETRRQARAQGIFRCFEQYALGRDGRVCRPRSLALVRASAMPTPKPRRVVLRRPREGHGRPRQANAPPAGGSDDDPGDDDPEGRLRSSVEPAQMDPQVAEALGLLSIEVMRARNEAREARAFALDALDVLAVVGGMR